MIVANKKFVVKLSSEERKRLSEIISKGKSAAKIVLKARILLKADQSEEGEGWTDERICEALDTNVAMVTRVRSRLVDDGLDAVLARKKRATPPIQPIFDGERQAQLIALACSKPPPGYARWTLRLLADTVVEREIVAAAHFNTVGRALKKTGLLPIEWVIFRHLDAMACLTTTPWLTGDRCWVVAPRRDEYARRSD